MWATMASGARWTSENYRSRSRNRTDPDTVHVIRKWVVAISYPASTRATSDTYVGETVVNALAPDSTTPRICSTRSDTPERRIRG